MWNMAVSACLCKQLHCFPLLFGLHALDVTVDGFLRAGCWQRAVDLVSVPEMWIYLPPLPAEEL